MNTIKHVAIIPDGNRRWAKSRGLPSVEGHRYASEETVPQLLDAIKAAGIEYFTFWALSPENFTKRTKFEMDSLMLLMRHFLKNRIKEFHEKNVRMQLIGNIAALPKDVQNQLQEAIELTKNNTSLTVIFGINYGGRDEMLRAIKKLISDNISPDDLTKEIIGQTLDTKNIPDPDLIIRTGGEKRTSGFMLWQAEYAEYMFLDKLFPDFTPDDLSNCIEEYYQRQRRFGK